MTILHILRDNIKTVPDALAFMGFTSVPSPTDLKVKFRKLSLSMHPDHGGHDDSMKDLNASYAILGKVSGTTHGRSYESPEEFAARQQRQTEKNKIEYEMMLKIFNDAFDEHDFLKYLSQFIDDSLTIKIIIAPFRDSYYHSSFSAGVTASNHDHTTVVYLNYSITKSYNASGGLTASDQDQRDLLFTVSMVSEIYFDKRKQKIGQRDWKWHVGMRSLEDFEAVLPPLRMKKIFAGGLKKIFKKADMILGLEHEADGRWANDRESMIFRLFPHNERPKYSDGCCLYVKRTVILRQATYTFNAFFYYNEFGKLVGSMFHSDKLAYMEETVDTMEKIIKVIKDLRKEVTYLDEKTDGVKIDALVHQYLKKRFMK